MDDVKSGLSTSCDAVLGQLDMYATPHDDGISAQVFGADGDYHFTVRRHIDPADLISMLRYGRHMLGVGRQVGEESVKAGLRALIGAAPLEPLN